MLTIEMRRIGSRAGLFALVLAMCANDNVLSQTFSLKPVSSTGPHMAAGTEIHILPGGAIVDLEIVFSGWASKDPLVTLLTCQALLNPSGYLGANANPANPGVNLVPLGYAPPDPNGGNRAEGFFQAVRVCSVSLRNCTNGQPVCAANEGSCIHNPRFVFPESTMPITVLQTNALNMYIAGAVTSTSECVIDLHDLEQGYLATLRLVIPPNATGTYTVSIDPNAGETFLADCPAVPVDVEALRPARIVITDTLPHGEALGIPKNRFVTFEPSESGDEPIAYQIALTASTIAPDSIGYTAWVGAPAFTPTMGHVSQVVSAPVFRQWTESVIQIGDCEIMPGSTYEVRGTINGVTFMYPQSIATSPEPLDKEWGDVTGIDGQDWSPPDGFANVKDILGVLARARGDATAPAPTRANLLAIGSFDPCLNHVVNTADVLIAVIAVRGLPYPLERFPILCPACP